MEVSLEKASEKLAYVSMDYLDHGMHNNIHFFHPHKWCFGK